MDSHIYLDSTHDEDDYPILIGPSGFWGGTDEDQGSALYFSDDDDALHYVSVAIELELPSIVY